MHERKLCIIEEIIGWKRQDEKTKLYFIQAYLLGWASEEQIHVLTTCDK
ncbi:MAG: hypothetical protein IJK63_11355 [Oscillospiraceae bacterium]|nr:hypothetical protein [Oscillospiraceae bacterium]